MPSCSIIWPFHHLDYFNEYDVFTSAVCCAVEHWSNPEVSCCCQLMSKILNALSLKILHTLSQNVWILFQHTLVIRILNFEMRRHGKERENAFVSPSFSLFRPPKEQLLAEVQLLRLLPTTARKVKVLHFSLSLPNSLYFLALGVIFQLSTL